MFWHNTHRRRKSHSSLDRVKGRWFHICPWFFSNFTFDIVAGAVNARFWFHFCENVEIFMKSIEWDHGSSLIAVSVNYHAYTHLQNLIRWCRFLWFCIRSVVSSISGDTCIYMAIATTFIDASNVANSISVLNFCSNLTFDDVSKSVLVRICRHFCKNIRICMKSFECDRRSGLIVFNVHFDAYKHFQNLNDLDFPWVMADSVFWRVLHTPSMERRPSHEPIRHSSNYKIIHELKKYSTN